MDDGQDEQRLRDMEERATIAEEATRVLAELARNAGARLSAIEDVTHEIGEAKAAVAAIEEQIPLLVTSADVEERVTAVEGAERTRRRRAYLVAGLALALVVALVLLLLYIAVGNRRNGQEVVECTRPSQAEETHECFDANARRTARVVYELRQTVICTDGFDGADAINECVDDAMRVYDAASAAADG